MKRKQIKTREGGRKHIPAPDDQKPEKSEDKS